jgi:hypothetical protein
LKTVFGVVQSDSYVAMLGPACGRNGSNFAGAIVLFHKATFEGAILAASEGTFPPVACTDEET